MSEPIGDESVEKREATLGGPLRLGSELLIWDRLVKS